MSNKINALQKLKTLINPEVLTFTGEIVSVVGVRSYLVRPLGDQLGGVVCTASISYAVGTRVQCRGSEIVGESQITGSLIFIEV